MTTTPKQPQATDDSTKKSTIKNYTRSRFVSAALLLAGAGIVLVSLVSWRLMLPESSTFTRPNGPKTVPSSLAEEDVKEIANLCRLYTFGFAMDKLRAGEFGWFVRSSRVFFRQKIDQLKDDRDGTYRAYTVVYDKRDPDGFIPWSRHQLIKTNGHWIILRSY